MKRFLLLMATIMLLTACARAQEGDRIWIGEMIAYRLDTTYVLADYSSIQQLSLDMQPGWQIFINRSSAGSFLSAFARVKHRDKWVCGVGVPQAKDGRPMTYFFIRDCEVFFGYVDVVNAKTGAGLSTEGTPERIDKL